MCTLILIVLILCSIVFIWNIFRMNKAKVKEKKRQLDLQMIIYKEEQSKMDSCFKCTKFYECKLRHHDTYHAPTDLHNYRQDARYCTEYKQSPKNNEKIHSNKAI
jgi:hypothetical protein